MIKTQVSSYSFGLFVVVISCSLSNTSCVGKKKFLYEVSTRDSMVTQLNTRVIELNQEIARQKLQIAEKTGENNALRELQDKQDRQINRLQQEIEKLTNQSLSQQQLMDISLKKKQEELATKEKVIENMQLTIEKQEKNLKDVLTILQEALRQYDPKELSFEFRDGKAYIGLSEKLLFKTGSDQLGREASGVLESVAGVLVNHPEFNIEVEGHTDNVPVRSKEFNNNWDLSVMRAASVVKVLTKDFSLNPSQVTASGRGEYLPKASNETSEGRAQNRRMEIILSLRLDEVYQLIRNN